MVVSGQIVVAFAILLISFKPEARDGESFREVHVFSARLKRNTISRTPRRADRKNTPLRTIYRGFERQPAGFIYLTKSASELSETMRGSARPTPSFITANRLRTDNNPVELTLIVN